MLLNWSYCDLYANYQSSYTNTSFSRTYINQNIIYSYSWAFIARARFIRVSGSLLCWQYCYHSWTIFKIQSFLLYNWTCFTIITNILVIYKKKTNHYVALFLKIVQLLADDCPWSILAVGDVFTGAESSYLHGQTTFS